MGRSSEWQTLEVTSELLALQRLSPIAEVLKNELQDCERAVKAAEEQIGGRRKASDVMAFIDRVRKGDVRLDGDTSAGAGGFSSALLATGTSIHYSTEAS